MSEKKKQKPKIGAGHPAAMWRLGLKELRGAVYPGSNVAQPGELGIYGSLTPGEVRDGKEKKEKTEKKDDRDKRDGDEEKRSVLADRTRQAEGRDDHGREDREQERE